LVAFGFAGFACGKITEVILPVVKRLDVFVVVVLAFVCVELPDCGILVWAFAACQVTATMVRTKTRLVTKRRDIVIAD
jgi:hypothetical protein